MTPARLSSSPTRGKPRAVGLGYIRKLKNWKYGQDGTVCSVTHPSISIPSPCHESAGIWFIPEQSKPSRPALNLLGKIPLSMDQLCAHNFIDQPNRNHRIAIIRKPDTSSKSHCIINPP
ncbi:hypothetical protein Pst134EA_002960 [Puccinia striiformis f. sp. tritici]|uniref:hypothetical protein n=1 Tax=Puccinia striiformis f. sp. tritici TaxID=168172 RepID=UPI00200818C6|nr:hypothetical protein Pst134EA_002960 [Puccinia striiformis f. sp. tritici]KAH9472338.1 hypothetical protein Pst134EA_002960 [Puccinia striiformis f. sp. tritici]